MNKLKKMFVGLGAFQCVLLLIAYLFLFFYKSDLLLIILFVYSLFLGFFIIENKEKKLLANNTSLIFLLFLFFYGVFNCIISYVFLGAISDEIYHPTVFYAISIPALLLGILSKKNKNFYPDIYESNISSDKQSPYANFLKQVLLVILIAYKTYFFYSAGVLFSFSNAGTDSRLEMFSNVGQLDVIVGLFIIGLFSYFVYYYKNLPKKTVLVVSCLLFYYILMQLSVGNRRDFVPIVIGIFWVFVNIKRLKFGIIGFAGILLAIFLFNYLGTLRAGDNGSNRSQLIYQTMTNNEFVYPFFTLTYEVEQNKKQPNNYNFQYGTTYLINPILILIPRAIYPGKPDSLANEFLERKYGRNKTIGFAYNPVTESFVNFGYFGSFLVFFLLGRFLVFLLNYKNQVFNFLIFITLIDFCRGEMGTYLYQFLFISIFLILHRKKK